jgi:hypothetical protein
MTTHWFVCLLIMAPAAHAGPDEGNVTLAQREERRTKVFKDGRSIVAYRQSGAVTGGSGGPWRQATLLAQGSLFKGAAGNVIADVALWETTDADGDVVWGVLRAPSGGPDTFQIKAGTRKWKGIAGPVTLLDSRSRWQMDWTIANHGSAAVRGNPGDYSYHDTGLSFHGPHVPELSRKLPNGVTLVYSNQSGVLLSDNRESKSPRNLATCYDRGTTYLLNGKNLGDIMLLEDTDPDGDTVWLYHEWWYGKGPGSYEFIGGTGKWNGISGFGKTLDLLRDRLDDYYMLKSEVHWNLK